MRMHVPYFCITYIIILLASSIVPQYNLKHPAVFFPFKAVPANRSPQGEPKHRRSYPFGEAAREFEDVLKLLLCQRKRPYMEVSN